MDDEEICTRTEHSRRCVDQLLLQSIALRFEKIKDKAGSSVTDEQLTSKITKSSTFQFSRK